MPRQKQEQQQEGWGDRVTPPPVIDGFAVKEKGLELEGPVLSRLAGDYGPYYVIKVTAGHGSYRVGDEIKAIQPGLTLAVSEVNAIRPLADRLGKGPVAARMTFLGKDGNAWDVDLRVKPLF